MTVGPTAQGKVRDIYDLGDRLLLVATDRISAYDVVLPNTIPHKGRVLTQLSRFWFDRTAEIVPNHMLSTEHDTIVETLREAGVAISFPGRPEDACVLDEAGAAVAAVAAESWLDGRSMLCRKAEVVPIECVARGYLCGSAWAEYRNAGTVCGIRLPRGLKESDRLPEPIFTPATKAVSGHDANVDFEHVVHTVGAALAAKLMEATIALYVFAHEYALARGIIIADTKFEFGMIDGELRLIDEALTPDSSRFWPASDFKPGRGQPSFDKQFVRDWLDASGWDRRPPPPELPAEIVAKTSEKYIEAYERLTGRPFSHH